MTPLAYAKAIGLALIVGALFFGGRSCGKQAGDAEVQQLKAKHAQVLAGIAKKTADAAEKVRKVEHLWADAFVAVAVKHQKELNDAKAKGDAVAAGLRAGTERLQERWRCPAVPRAPEAPPGGRLADAGADDRADSAGRIVAAAAACDAQVRGLQAVLIAERQ